MVDGGGVGSTAQVFLCMHWNAVKCVCALVFYWCLVVMQTQRLCCYLPESNAGINIKAEWSSPFAFVCRPQSISQYLCEHRTRLNFALESPRMRVNVTGGYFPFFYTSCSPIDASVDISPQMRAGPSGALWECSGFTLDLKSVVNSGNLLINTRKSVCHERQRPQRAVQRVF